MPIYQGLYASEEQRDQITALTKQLKELQDFPNASGEEFARLFEERQRAKDQLKTLLASLKPPTLEELAVEIELLQTKLAQIEAKLAEDVRAKRERREPVKRDERRKL